MPKDLKIVSLKDIEQFNNDVFNLVYEFEHKYRDLSRNLLLKYPFLSKELEDPERENALSDLYCDANRFMDIYIPYLEEHGIGFTE